MRKFKVICLNVSGHSNKIFKHGDIVTEDQFIPGDADRRVGTGHIEEIKEDITHTVTEEDIVNNPGEDLAVGENIIIPAEAIVEPPKPAPSKPATKPKKPKK